ncbi:MAG: 30S ribosomal protein S3 [DPANN group archaeon]|nr:30S ribosomal protein S3 [DPANN group archaeon]
MIERKFIEDGIKTQEVEKYLNDLLSAAEYSHTDLKITPVSTRLSIYVGRPGIAIGRAGKNIQILTNELKNRFRLKNPQIDIKNIVDPNIDAAVIAKRLAAAFERKPKSMGVVNMYLDKIIASGAVGAEITISGKISGARSRSNKFLRGYIKKCGDIAINYVDKSFCIAKLKPGVLGVKVKIMKTLPASIMLEKNIKQGKFKINVEDKDADKKTMKKEIVDDKKADKEDITKEEKVSTKKETVEDKKDTTKEEVVTKTETVKDTKVDKKDTVKEEVVTKTEAVKDKKEVVEEIKKTTTNKDDITKITETEKIKK